MIKQIYIFLLFLKTSENNFYLFVKFFSLFTLFLNFISENPTNKQKILNHTAYQTLLFLKPFWKTITNWAKFICYYIFLFF